jgi:hypothetical protein
MVTIGHVIKFLGILINDSMNWSYHVESIIPKLSSGCYILRSIKPYMPINTMKTIYYSCFNTIMSYGLFLWENLPHTLKIFRMQKMIIRIMTSCNNRASCRNLFRKLEILPLASQYIFSLMLFMISNKNLFVLNSDKHNVSVRHANNLYQSSSNFTVYQKGVCYMGIKVYNNLPPDINDESYNPTKFKTYLLHFPHAHYFYSIEEYFQYKTSASYRLITSKH